MRNEASVVVALSAENKGAFEMFDRLRKEQEKAKQGMESFNQQAQRTKAGMGQFGELLGQGSKLLGSFGLALGAGKIAMDTFKGAIASTQATADAYASATEQAKGATEAFFQTIATGDFSNLINNMEYAIEKAREYYEAYDKLEDMKFGFGFTDSKDKARLKDIRKQIIDGNLSREQEESLIKEADEIAKGLIDGAKATTEQAEKTYLAIFKGALGEVRDEKGKRINLTDEDFKKALDIYVKTQQRSDPKLNKLADKFTKMEDIDNSTWVGSIAKDAGMSTLQGLGAMVGFIPDKLDNERTAKKVEQGDKFSKLVGDILKQNGKEGKIVLAGLKAINKIKDEKKEEILKLRKEADDGEAKAYELAVSMNEVKNRVKNRNKPNKGTGAGVVKAPKVDKEEEQRLLNEQIARQQAKALPLFDYERVKIKIDELTDYIKAQEDKLKVTVKGSVEFEQIQKDIQTKKTELHNIREANAPAPLNMDKISQRAKEIDTATFKAPEGVEDFTNGMQTMENSINSVANAFGAFTSLVDGSSDSFLSWLGNATRAITSVLPLIEMLTAKQKVSAAVNTADAAAKGASSVASVPFVGPALAVGAVAMIVATLAKTQKFATGGIVGGHSYYGDKILARVNSGELILNNRQQKTIYEGLSPHIDRTQNINVGGSFKIQGKDLVLSYNRTTKQLNRN